MAEDFGGVVREGLIHFGEDSGFGFDEDEANECFGDARIAGKEVVEEFGEFAHEFDSDETAANEDDGEKLFAALFILFDVGLFEEVDDVVSEENGIGEGFKAEGVLAAGDEGAVGDATEGENDVVVIDFVGEVVGLMGGVDFARVEVDTIDGGFDEAGLGDHAADGIDGMAGLKNTAAGLEKKRGHEEVVVLADERDVNG